MNDSRRWSAAQLGAVLLCAMCYALLVISTRVAEPSFWVHLVPFAFPLFAALTVVFALRKSPPDATGAAPTGSGVVTAVGRRQATLGESRRADHIAWAVGLFCLVGGISVFPSGRGFGDGFLVVSEVWWMIGAVFIGFLVPRLVRSS
jgi:hypothetical protein